MQKQEFEKISGRTVVEADYEVIEKVYQFYPLISEITGKEEIAELYKKFGTAILYDMLPRAERYCELGTQLRHALSEVEKVRGAMEALSNGRMQQSSETDYSRMKYSGERMIEVGE